MSPERAEEEALAEIDERAEEERLARVAREILDTAPTDAQLRACEVFLDRGMYTTTALRALESWLRGNEDHEGAALLTSFAVRFAIHEAETA